MTGLTAFDTYRDAETRKMMVEHVMHSRFLDAHRAVAELRSLNHVGLAYLFKDAAATAQHTAEYDPCQICP
jgi:hypothetical protein